jgi:hypothetical protein
VPEHSLSSVATRFNRQQGEQCTAGRSLQHLFFISAALDPVAQTMLSPVRKRGTIGKPRALLVQECAVIDVLLRSAGVTQRYESRLVLDVDDGDMRGIVFVSGAGTRRYYAGALATAAYQDSDGELVSVALNVDQYGDVYEIDVWKSSLRPLLRYPQPQELRLPRLKRGDSRQGNSAQATAPGSSNR